MPTVSDVKPILDALDLASFDEGVAHGAVTMVPLVGQAGPESDWLTLAEAGDFVVISEVSDAGQVPVLTVTNTAKRPVLLVDGEELIGAKQNRILNTTVLVAADTTLRIPVSCVEVGRWAARSASFARGDASLHASARAKKALRVTESLRRGAGHRSDQGEVWDDVAALSRRP